MIWLCWLIEHIWSPFWREINYTLTSLILWIMWLTQFSFANTNNSVKLTPPYLLISYHDKQYVLGAFFLFCHRLFAINLLGVDQWEHSFSNSLASFPKSNMCLYQQICYLTLEFWLYSIQFCVILSNSQNTFSNVQGDVSVMSYEWDCWEFQIFVYNPKVASVKADQTTLIHIPTTRYLFMHFHFKWW